MAGADEHRSPNPGAWMVRAIVWFTAASMLVTTSHELVHACVAYVLGVPSTLFSYFVDLNLQPGAPGRVLIGIAGPLFCLVLGAAAWLALRWWRHSPAGLPLIYFSVFGLGTFCGNLMSTSFGGDFRPVAIALGVPIGARYALTAVGALSLAAVHFWGGRQLVQWIPAGVGRVSGMVGIVALPVLVGTAAVVLLNQPMPRSFTTLRFLEASFWVFAALGALGASRPFQDNAVRPGLRWADAAVLLLAVVGVRLAVPGIAFTP
jgi:hypothetical protein